jgi:fructokinase
MDNSPLLAIVHHSIHPAISSSATTAPTCSSTPHLLPEGWRSHCRWVHFGGISLARQPLAGKLAALAEQLKLDGVRISYDPNYRLLMDQRPTTPRCAA